MEKYVRYTGKFLSRAGTEWHVDILQDADKAFSGIGALTFEADEPLEISWEHTDKEEVICGSTATLKIESPSDRAYIDLYTVKVGTIRMDVYKDGSLYWSGALDPEFYEEPYESDAHYVVALTFSDFGILDRLKYNLSGMQSIKSIVEYAMQQSGISYKSINTDYVSTALTDGMDVISGLSVRSENFTDEDGEQTSIYDSLEGVLQPLSLRIVQRGGVIYLYDINGLYSASKKAIYWSGDSQTLGVDKVANNVVVTFSPYSESELITEDTLEYKGSYDVSHYNLANEAPVDNVAIKNNPAKYGEYSEEYGEYYSYYPEYNNQINGEWDYDYIDFTIYLSENATGIASIGSGCKYFHILPFTGSASECSGVAYAFRTGGHNSIKNGGPVWKLHSGTGTIASLNKKVLTTERMYLPKLSDSDQKKFRIRVTEEILVDCRYNPFGEDGEGNEEGNDGRLEGHSSFVMIPVQITLYDDNGTALYHYSNKTIAMSAPGVGCLSKCKGEWVAGADSGTDCRLEYYDPEDLKGGCGIRGWKANRHTIGRPDGYDDRKKIELYGSFKALDDGEYIPYPPCAGYLEVKIMSGINGYTYGYRKATSDESACYWVAGDIYSTLRWMLYKVPTVEVVNNNLIFDSASLEDIEYSGYINKAAKEELSLETICGSAPTCPTARGAYYATSDGTQITEVTRADRADAPEKLLIGTLYSQYADRKTTLSGEASADGGLYAYTEANQGDTIFMLMSDEQDVITDTTEAEYCEIRPDEYDNIEEVE